MEGIFIKLLNLSIQASILITVVLLLRFILNKSPKSIKCLLWALVAIRLVCPFSIESKFSLAPDAEVVSMDNYVGMPNVLSKTTGSDRYVKGYAESYDHEVVTVEKKNTDPLHIFSIIWLGGVVILAVYALGSCLKIWRRVKLSIRTTENIYICDRIDSPFIFGIIKPRIYLPSRMNEEQKESVIAHERAHLKRLDHFWKPFGFGLLSVYWFNPLCWLAYILFCRDIELACDEKVIKDMDAKQKKIYSKVLLSFSESEKHVLACPLAFGEVGVKERIKSILNYKKPTFWIIAVAVISILVTSVLFLTNPQNNTYEITFHIPAECEGALVFADEEISPKGKTVSFLVGQDVGDTAIQLKGVEVKEENAYDEPVYATPGMPAKMEVEKGGWFQVGIYASNDTTIGELGYAMDIQSSYHTIFEETNSIYHNVLSEVVSRVGLENAYSWNNTVEFKEDADVLIKMANDDTDEYEVYGIMSAEYGAFGLLLNDKKEGEDHWNFAYVPWFYSGAPDGQPVLEPTSDGKFLFTYVYAYDDAPLWRECILDCGYDTGYTNNDILRSQKDLYNKRQVLLKSDKEYQWQSIIGHVQCDSIQSQ